MSINVPFKISGTKSMNTEAESNMMNYCMCLVFQVTKFNLFLQKPIRIQCDGLLTFSHSHSIFILFYSDEYLMLRNKSKFAFTTVSSLHSFMRDWSARQICHWRILHLEYECTQCGVDGLMQQQKLKCQASSVLSLLYS